MKNKEISKNPNKDPEKDIKRKYIEFQLLMQQISQIQQQVSTINSNILELRTLTINLDKIKELKKNKEVLIPVGSNIFIKGSLKDTDKVIMGIGSDVLKEKTIPETKASIEEQIKELENINLELEFTLEDAVKKIEILEKELSQERS